MAEVTARLAAALVDRYRLERELGAGGMATVYLAHDLKHDRKVAVKVLRPELAAVIGAERFLAEIKTTANLQHPHILPLFDSGAADSFLFYVMPYIEGVSLRDRITREHQLSVDDAVRIATEVAAALDYAHRHGVIHRDIKPENILLHDGSALVADFGIALAVSTAGHRMTETGMSLGTPHYMSPEQAMGEREITARSDVYALACVTYEMLVGEPPFNGPTAQAIFARVMTEEPRRLTIQRKTIPPHVEDAVLTALEKLPADRFATAAEFAAAIAHGDPARRHLTATSIRHASGAPVAPQRRVIAGGIALGALAFIAAWGWLRPVHSAASVVRWNALPSGDLTINGFAVSPNGLRVVYSTGDKGQLMLREVDDLVAKPVPEAPNAYGMFFSPDGQRLAYYTAAPGALKVVSLAGGAATTLVRDSAYYFGGDWGADGWIYYLGGSAGQVALMRVRSDGGAPQLVARPDTAKDELFFNSPQLLPGDKKALITIVRRGGTSDIAVMQLATGARTVLTRGIQAAYANTGQLIVLTSDGALSAAPFNPGRGVVTGPFVPLRDRVPVTSLSGDVAGFMLTPSGTLVYIAYPSRYQLVRVSRGGDVRPVDPPLAGNVGNNIALSPDGKHLAFEIDSNGTEGLWVRSLENGTPTFLAGGGTTNSRPSWTPDGRSVIFISDRTGLAEVYRIPADGSAPATLFFSQPRGVDEAELSRDGTWLTYRLGVGAGRDLYAVRVGHDTAQVPLVATNAEEDAPALSPDGHWLAYNSDESGKPEVYVRPFPNTSTAKYPISSDGGTEPRWSHRGGELFYRDGNGNLIAARIGAEPAFHVEESRVLFPAAEYLTDGNDHNYEVSPDDQSFYFLRPLDKQPSQLIMVQNWFLELKGKAGK